MRKKSKPEIILTAFTKELPVDEAWYQDRLAICKVCPYNSLNTPPEGFIQKARKIIDNNKPHCRACGCYIEEKCGMKEEACGLETINQAPKWPRLLVHTMNKEDWNIHNNSPEKINIDLAKDGNSYVVRYLTPVTDKSDTSIEILMEGLGEILEVKVACSCTLPSFFKLGEDLYRVKLAIKNDRLERGKLFNKGVYVKYSIAEGEKTVEKSVPIMLEGLKK